MRNTRTKRISWMLMLAMVFSLISPGGAGNVCAEVTYDGYVYVTMERLTLGQGFAENPMKVGYREEDSVEDIVKRAYGDKIIFTASDWGAYMTGYADGGQPGGWTPQDIPQAIKDALGDSLTANAKRMETTTLSSGDYVGSSGYSFAVDNVSPNTGMSGVNYSKEDVADTYRNGSVIRIQFTMYYGDLNITPSEWGTPLIAFANKDALIQDVVDYTGDETGDAYKDAMAVLEDWDATQEEVAAAQHQLQAALSDTCVKKHEVAVAYVKENAEPPVLGSEWSVLSVARSGVEDEQWYDTYFTSVENTVKENGTNKIKENQSSDNSRVIIGLSAIGADPSDVGGYDLLKPLADFDYVKKQGVNGSVYALIALDCKDYEIPTAVKGATQTTRELLVAEILKSALETGGWAYSGTVADPDMTSMALQALAPYYKSNASVKTEVNKALTALSEMQDENGSFASWGSTNSMSCAQVVCALTALGIDLEKDQRFIKNGNSVLDAMLSFYDEQTGGYRYLITDNKVNTAATIQVAYALTAYSRWAEGKSSLYDMMDAEILYACRHETTEQKNEKEATCTAEGYTGDVYCSACGIKVADGKIIEKKAHSVVVDSAVAPTETTEGRTEGSHCSVCQQIIVPVLSVAPLQTETVLPEQNAEVENTVKKPGMTSFKKVVSPKKEQIKLTWKKKRGITGYQIQVSGSSKFKAKGTKKYTIKKAATTSRTIKKLKSNKKYYVRIRTYVTKEINGKKITKYSKWVKKTVRVK